MTLSLGLWKQLDLALYGADLVGQALREVLGEDVVFTGACDSSENPPISCKNYWKLWRK